jgi:hypothetical protein
MNRLPRLPARERRACRIASRSDTAFVVLVLATALAGCSTTPVPTLLTLQQGPERAAASSPARAPFAIEILPVGLPARVDRVELVVTTVTGDVRVLDNLRWVTPPGDELREALSRRLAADHGMADASGLRIVGADVVRARLMVRRFDTRLDDGSFVIDADWQLTRPGDAAASPTCRFTARVASPSARLDGSAHRVAVERWAAQLAAFARSWVGKPDTSCPLSG